MFGFKDHTSCIRLRLNFTLSLLWHYLGFKCHFSEEMLLVVFQFGIRLVVNSSDFWKCKPILFFVFHGVRHDPGGSSRELNPVYRLLQWWNLSTSTQDGMVWPPAFKKCKFWNQNVRIVDMWSLQMLMKGKCPLSCRVNL